MPLDPEEFIVIGENIHTTRTLSRKGKLVIQAPEGCEAVRFYDLEGRRFYLPIPEAVKKTRDYEEGRVKHIKIALQAAMEGDGEGLAYLRRQVQRQVEAGAHFLDLNVDEVSLKTRQQQEAMQWLVRAVQKLSPVPLSIDSSNPEIIAAGLEVYRGEAGRPLLNSASLERLEVLDLAAEHQACVIVTAAGESAMPRNAAERLENAARMVEATRARGIAPAEIYIDPLIFPISVDAEYGRHSLEAIRRLRARYGPEIHLTGGFSNVSFGLPARRLINEVFLKLAVEAGADSGIVDPVASKPARALAMGRDSTAYRLAEAMLLGRDPLCKTFLRAWRQGELERD